MLVWHYEADEDNATFLMIVSIVIVSHANMLIHDNKNSLVETDMNNSFSY